MPLLMLLLLLACFWPNAADARVYRARLSDGPLLIQAPRAYVSAGKKNFVDDSKSYKVTLRYGGLTVEANQASLDQQQRVVELTGGFRGSFADYSLTGDYFRLNSATGNFSGQNMRISFLTAYLQTADLQFNGSKIEAAGVTVSPLDQPVFSADLGRLEIYPGYFLAGSIVPKLFFVPFYYIPLYFNDQRRSYFTLPFPAFEAKQDIYHGNNGVVHSNYFIDPKLYGDIALRLSDTDGYGAGVKQVVRLSDNHQLDLNYLNWQKAPAQLKLSYVFNYFKGPPPPDHRLSFQEQSELVRKIAGLEPKWSLTCDYSQNEDVNRGRIDRSPELTVSSRLQGILYNHAFTLTPSLAYGRIKETKFFPETAAPQAVNNDFLRRRLGLNCTYFLETPYIQPYVNRALLALDYQHANYDPGTANRDRLGGSLTIRRPLLNLDGLYYEFILTKVLVNSGLSPFLFEEYGLQLKDNGALDIYLQNDYLIGGGHFIYDLSNGGPYNEIYYFGVKALGDSYATIRRDRRMQLWEFAIMKKDLAF